MVRRAAPPHIYFRPWHCLCRARSGKKARRGGKPAATGPPVTPNGCEVKLLLISRLLHRLQHQMHVARKQLPASRGHILNTLKSRIGGNG